MSPRKSRLDSALDDLRYLPRVLKALEVLNGEQEKVRALMGRMMPGEIVERMAAQAAPRRDLVYPENPLRSAVLDTPERREYEAARKSGTVVKDDPFANASEAQRERMAEQRALVERMRGPRGKIAAVETAAEVGAISPAEAMQVVTEVLDESANGSAGAEMQSGGFTDG